ncbi:hypothetical protein L1049_002937 [Liquidambar formosana]|uniref:MADS-box domain-containing protein n=1 Tax=Liquidambar formosana TaxID=63359 RepID=A0AAP0R989_LIQFO
MVKRKIEIKKCEDQKKRYVTFSKRRSGLQRKAAELSVLCDVKIAMVTSSPGERPKIYSFGHPSVDEVIQAFCTNSPPSTRYDDSIKCLYQEVKELEHEIKREQEKMKHQNDSDGFWWLNDIEKFESIEELLAFADGLRRLKYNVTAQLYGMQCTSASNSGLKSKEEAGVRPPLSLF